MNESFVSIYLAWDGTDSSKTMSLLNFGFSSKKKNDKGGKENVEDRPSSDIQSENVDQAPAAPDDVATGSGASASLTVTQLKDQFFWILNFGLQSIICNSFHGLLQKKNYKTMEHFWIFAGPPTPRVQDSFTLSFSSF